MCLRYVNGVERVYVFGTLNFDPDKCEICVESLSSLLRTSETHLYLCRDCALYLYDP